MPTESFEYAVKKDVKNNPIVREVDRERHRDMFRSIGTGAFLVIVVLFWAWQHFELLRHGYRFEQMQQELVAEQETNRHLRLEIETLASPARIEELRGRGLEQAARFRWDTAAAQMEEVFREALSAASRAPA